jgi:hypothetical protein
MAELAADDIVPGQRGPYALFHRVQGATQAFGELFKGELVALGDALDDGVDFR